MGHATITHVEPWLFGNHEAPGGRRRKRAGATVRVSIVNECQLLLFCDCSRCVAVVLFFVFPISHILDVFRTCLLPHFSVSPSPSPSSAPPCLSHFDLNTNRKREHERRQQEEDEKHDVKHTVKVSFIATHSLTISNASKK